jgi:hypothetical protein
MLDTEGAVIESRNYGSVKDRQNIMRAWLGHNVQIAPDVCGTEYQRRYRQQNRARIKYLWLRASAKRSGREFTLKYSDYLKHSNAG